MAEQVEALLAQGLDHFTRRDHVQASGCWVRALELDPDNVRARTFLAYLHESPQPPSALRLDTAGEIKPIPEPGHVTMSPAVSLEALHPPDGAAAVALVEPVAPPSVWESGQVAVATADSEVTPAPGGAPARVEVADEVGTGILEVPDFEGPVPAEVRAEAIVQRAPPSDWNDRSQWAPNAKPQDPAKAVTAQYPVDKDVAEHLVSIPLPPEPAPSGSGVDEGHGVPSAANPAAADVEIDVGGLDDLDVDVSDEPEPPASEVTPVPVPPSAPAGPAAVATPLSTTHPQIAALLQQVLQQEAQGDLAGGVDTVDRVLELDPNQPDALAFLARHENSLVAMYSRLLGPLERTPRIVRKPDDALWASMHRNAALLIDIVDGRTSFKDILDLCGMSAVDATRILAQLLIKGVIKT